jgi:hypothetical protein
MVFNSKQQNRLLALLSASTFQNLALPKGYPKKVKKLHPKPTLPRLINQLLPLRSPQRPL